MNEVILSRVIVIITYSNVKFIVKKLIYYLIVVIDFVISVIIQNEFFII